MEVPLEPDSYRTSQPAGSRVALPPDVAGPFQVYVNGVAQELGRDYRVEGNTLVFSR